MTEIKKLLLLLILLCVPLIGFGQQTYVPDDNFEQYLIMQGYDNVLDDSVITANINTVTDLTGGLHSRFISDLTGIEDFIALTILSCSNNSLTSLDLSKNTALTKLECNDNSLTSLDLSKNTVLTSLDCSNNSLTSLDLRKNTVLTSLDCSNNSLTILDVSHNSYLNMLYCTHNELNELNVSNGNNSNFIEFYTYNNPNLSLITVDNVYWSNNNWFNYENRSKHLMPHKNEGLIDLDSPNFWTDLPNNWSIDPQHYFIENEKCTNESMSTIESTKILTFVKFLFLLSLF